MLLANLQSSLHRPGVSPSFQRGRRRVLCFSRANIDTKFVVFDKTVICQKKPSQAMRYALGKKRAARKDISEKNKKTGES